MSDKEIISKAMTDLAIATAKVFDTDPFTIGSAIIDYLNTVDPRTDDEWTLDSIDFPKVKEDPSDYDESLVYADDDCLIDGVGFADPGGESALRAATADNPRNLPCPTCSEPNRLTPIDRARGYQCDECARQTERGY